MVKLFIFGLGYTGKRLALEALQLGFDVSGTVRSSAKAEELKNEKINALVYDDSDPVDAVLKAQQKEAVTNELRESTHVLVTAAPSPERGDPMLNGFADILAECQPSIQWVGYLSTTGVYGDRGGDVVDETSPVGAKSRRGQLRVDAENAWIATGLPVHIFRLPGIYGPGRGPLQKIREGDAKRISKPGHCFNRIHVDDIVGAVLASVARPSGEGGRVYNVVDDLPAPQEDVVAYGCELLGIRPPPVVPFEEASKTMSAMALSFWGESRKVISKRLKDELGYSLRYPTYREGLTAQKEEEDQRAAANGNGSGARSAVARRTFEVKGLFPLTAAIVALWRRVLRRPVQGTVCLLIDNGSVRAASTLSLRQVAASVQARIGIPVYPVSCRFSNRVKPEDLGGIPADTLAPFIEKLIARGTTDIVVLPFFFGRSAAVTEYLPQCVDRARLACPQLRVRVADCLVDIGVQADTRIAQILAALVEETVLAQGLSNPAVVVCDHGTPLREVHVCREVLARQVRALLDGKVSMVAEASMERREGAEFDFNDPLLEKVFDQPGMQTGDVVIAMVFLSPGKHAGDGGDVATILEDAMKSHPGLKTHMTRLVGSHPLVVDVLVDRARTILEC